MKQVRHSVRHPDSIPKKPAFFLLYAPKLDESGKPMQDAHSKVINTMNSKKSILQTLVSALGGGGAFACIKFMGPKQGAKVSADPDDYEFEDEDETIESLFIFLNLHFVQ